PSTRDPAPTERTHCRPGTRIRVCPGRPPGRRPQCPERARLSHRRHPLSAQPRRHPETGRSDRCRITPGRQRSWKTWPRQRWLQGESTTGPATDVRHRPGRKRSPEPRATTGKETLTVGHALRHPPLPETTVRRRFLPALRRAAVYAEWNAERAAADVRV